MKWIFALLFLFSVNLFAVESTPAKLVNYVDPNKPSQCNHGYGSLSNVTLQQCLDDYLRRGGWRSISVVSSSFIQPNQTVYCVDITNPNGSHQSACIVHFFQTPVPTYFCPPDGNPTFTVGPVTVNGSKVCQVPPKVCMMGAILRVASDGKETCVPNCSSAAGMAHQSQFFYQAGPTAGSTAGETKCYGQCAIQTVGGGGVQLANGAWTGNFTFTGANCPVIRPEPTIDSETNTGGNGDAPLVDESTTSEGTDNALGELAGAVSSATGSQVQPSATGPDGTSTLNDVAQTVADAANAQIQATSSQNVATGNLIANTTKDLQNTIIRTGTCTGSLATTN
ncbi:hypothetical protein NUK31_20915 [Aeromonas caviae]|uniref:hypothetical protein n=1 Tax=Aeromonas caviae TaxID=648 RepID=UPI00214EB43D|nr:hypothetical protein [Aeromonas caviae]MCR3895442.1 hypothetical protein [Aeromonas caviae]